MSKRDESIGEATGKSVADEGVGGVESFDFAAWLAGVTPVRRRLTIYGRGDLQAEIDELSQAEALALGAEREALVERLVKLTAELKASAITIEVEGRTSTWVTKMAAELREAGVEGEDIDFALIAAQSVSPRLTVDQVRALRETREAEVLRLANVVADANNRVVTLDPRFLHAASD